MKLGIIQIIILLTLGYNTSGQDSSNNQRQPFVIRDISTITKKTKSPLYIFKTENGILQLPVKSNSNYKRRATRIFKDFNIDWISSVEVLKDKSDTEKYGELGQYGVLIISLKDGTYKNLPRRLKKYKINE